jgi:hypothetical protein
MKIWMREMTSFLIFDLHFDKDSLSKQFANTHSWHQKDIPDWSVNATRQKVIANYWCTYVFGHFIVMLGLPIWFLSLFPSTSISYLISIFIAGLLAFPVLFVLRYWPVFAYEFLPQLETVKESYERKQLEQQERCRQAQLSNFSLALFFYVIAKTNNLETIQCNDPSANLMTKLFGVDQGSLKKNLELILVSGKRKNLTERKITEIRNRFNETYAFMEELQFAAGIEKLKELEMQFFRQ